MATLQLAIVTPERSIYSGNVETVKIPGTEGSFGVLPRHAPLLAAVAVGTIAFVEAGGRSQRAATSGGFAEVNGESVTVLAETAELAGQIDVARARAALQGARDRVNRADDEDVDRARAEAALSRAKNRLKLSGGQ